MTSEGTQIAGRYIVDRAIGRGGTGTVWLCRDKVLGRQVAVKQVGNLPGETTTDLDRALREARSAAGLNHPHVVAVFDAVEDDGRTWLVMEYLPSRTLAELLAAEGPLDPRRAAHLGAQAADGLAAAHARGVVHRDVKPGNILVTDDDRAKITDFGIALITGDPRLTQTGLVIGTPSYFSPEAARGGEPGPAGDVWALGASLYEAVEGHPPYVGRGGGNALALLVAIASEEAPPPTRAGALTGLIATMMARDPADRWTMPEVADRLAQIAAGGRRHPGDVGARRAAGPSAGDPARAAARSSARAPSEPEPVPEPVPAAPPGERRRRPGLLVLVAAVVLLLVAGVIGIVLAMSGDDDTPSAGDETTSDGKPRGTRSPSRAPESTGVVVRAHGRGDRDRAAGAGAQLGGARPRQSDPTAFAETYYGYLPDDTGSAYRLLSGDYRAQTSQEDYAGVLEHHRGGRGRRRRAGRRDHGRRLAHLRHRRRQRAGDPPPLPRPGRRRVGHRVRRGGRGRCCRNPRRPGNPA